MTDQLLVASLDLLTAALDPLHLYGQKDIGSFQSRINGMVGALWRESIDRTEFVMGMAAILRRNLSESWLAGAKRCGIAPDEMAPEELVAMEDFINLNISFTPAFGTSIAENNRADGALLRTHQGRIGLWVNAWNDARNQAERLACKDQKLRWIWNPFKTHCSDCTALNGQVRRATVWQQFGIAPQSRALECRGFNCGCRFAVSQLPVTKGRLPATTFR